MGGIMQILLQYTLLKALTQNSAAFCAHPWSRPRLEQISAKPSPYANLGQRFSNVQSSLFVATNSVSPLSSSESENSKEMNDSDEKMPPLDLPWSELQEWALKDNLPHYTITVPTKESIKRFALWRTMIQDVPELSGYDVAGIRRACRKQMGTTPIPDLAPLLDNFQFDIGGGVTGKAYGLTGVADGTTVTTPPLADWEATLPLGYVKTVGGEVFYELGNPSWSEDDSWMAKMRKTGRSELLKSFKVANAGRALASVEKNAVEDDGQLLLKLGGLTGILLAGATAVDMFHHHLTVSIFWV